MSQLSAANQEQDRLIEQMQTENNSLRKSVEELEDLADRLKRERDEANENLEQTMRELGEIA